MDELEQRLTNALQAEADALKPQSSTWDGRPVAATRRGWQAWLATAAVAAAVMVAATFAVTKHGGAPDAARPPVQATRSTALPTTTTAGQDPCKGGWTTPGTTVITGSTQSAAPGTVAILRFAGGLPDTATLCALVSGSDGTPLASGSAELNGAKLSYLTMITGQQTYFVGAFSGTTTTVAVAPNSVPTSRGEPGTVTVTATTAGVIDLGNGWHGYAVQAPRTASSTVDVTVSSAGTVVDRQTFALPTAPPVPSSGSTTPVAVATDSAPVSTTTSSSDDLSSAVRCGGQLPSALPGITAAIIPQPSGGWKFRLTNATTSPFTFNRMFGYAQVLTDRDVVQTISGDASLVLVAPTTIKPGGSTVFPVVGVDSARCAGGTVPIGDHPMHLVITGELNGRTVVFTAASFVLHFPKAGAPTLAN